MRFAPSPSKASAEREPEIPASVKLLISEALAPKDPEIWLAIWVSTSTNVPVMLPSTARVFNDASEPLTIIFFQAIVSMLI